MPFELALIHTLQSPFDNPLGRGVVLLLARWLIFGLVLYILALAVRTKQKGVRHAAREALFAGVLSLYIALLLSGWIHRLRPFIVSPDILRLVPVPLSLYSLPSAHASAAFGLAFPLVYADRTWGIAAVILALLVGLGRILAGVHYPTDILSGAIVGFLAFGIIRFMHRALRRTRFIHSA